MRIYRMMAIAISAALLAASVTACGAKPVEPPVNGAAIGQPAATGGSGGSAPDAGHSAADSPAAPEDQAASLDPAAARAFLESEKIPNGDIYLGEGGLLHINVVGLDEEIEGRFAEAFPQYEYKLVDVRFTHGELERAQEALIEQDLMRTYNIYASSVDVIGNRLEITMPDDIDGAQAAIEQHIDPDMIVYRLEALGEPHLVGKIHTVDEAGERLLILVDGQDEPSYWLSFNAFSVLTDASGGKIGFDAFAEGEPVRIWTTGMVLESMPAQATARKIELAA